VACLRTQADFKGDAILHEYQLLLDREFPSISFNGPERKVMNADDLQSFIASAIKLHKVVDSLAQRFQNLTIEGQRLTTEGEISDSEYG